MNFSTSNLRNVDLDIEGNRAIAPWIIIPRTIAPQTITPGQLPPRTIDPRDNSPQTIPPKQSPQAIPT